MGALTVLLEYCPKDALELANQRRRTLSKGLDELALDNDTTEQHKRQFSQARKAAEQQQHLPEEAAAQLWTSLPVDRRYRR